MYTTSFITIFFFIELFWNIIIEEKKITKTYKIKKKQGEVEGIEEKISTENTEQGFEKKY